MEEIYRAGDTGLHRHAAIKVLPNEFVYDAEWLARFQREAQVLASLSHPNIATLDTPALLIDNERLRENIRFMQEKAYKYGVNLRPHIKTHKILRIAKMQLEAGAVGITTAKTGVRFSPWRPPTWQPSPVQRAPVFHRE